MTSRKYEGNFTNYPLTGLDNDLTIDAEISIHQTDCYLFSQASVRPQSGGGRVATPYFPMRCYPILPMGAGGSPILVDFGGGWGLPLSFPMGGTPS